MLTSSGTLVLGRQRDRRERLVARTFTPKVNRHVIYYDAASKPRPGTITAIGSTNGGVTLRITHTGQTFGTGTVGILRAAFASPRGTNTWRPT